MTMRPELRPPWLFLDFGRRMRVIGWPVVGPALGAARGVVWLQVRNADLPKDRDPAAYFGERAAAAGVNYDIGLMTAADLRGFATARHEADGAAATVVATGGLGNAESVVPASTAPAKLARVGTINVVAVLDAPLTLAAQIEAVSIVAEARTAAVMDLSPPRLGEDRPVTGTGTDCIVVASPEDGGALSHCGLHTNLGRALAAAAYATIKETCASCLDASPRH